ncbi:MAG: hypothetical protein ABIQ02_08070 [Saprospiraceae bacterium]
MRKILLWLVLTISVSTMYGQRTVSTDSIKFFDGKTITVCSNVSSTFMTKGEQKTSFLNFGPEFPNQLFTVVIYEEDLHNFNYVPAEKLNGKNVCITGSVRMFDGAAEIIVKQQGQIKILN